MHCDYKKKIVLKHCVRKYCIEILTTISCGDFGGDIGDLIMEILYWRYGETLLLLFKSSKEIGNIISKNYIISSNVS